MLKCFLIYKEIIIFIFSILVYYCVHVYVLVDLCLIYVIYFLLLFLFIFLELIMQSPENRNCCSKEMFFVL